MHGSLFICLWALVAFIAYKICRYVANEVYHWRNARRLGCKPPPWLFPQDPLGITNIRRIYAADKESRVPQYLQDLTVKAIERHNSHTFKQSVMGTRFLFTVDPKVMQTILATQFKDFGIGMSRNGNFGALLGDGIVS